MLGVRGDLLTNLSGSLLAFLRAPAGDELLLIDPCDNGDGELLWDLPPVPGFLGRADLPVSLGIVMSTCNSGKN